MTKLVTVDPAHVAPAGLEEAAQLLLAGRLVAFPTETVYGLGANAMNEAAVKSIYAAKGRPSDNPLIVHIASREQVADFAREVPDEAKTLMDHFWGGPLTIILKKRPSVPDAVTAGLDSVALRLPSHPVANCLLRLCGAGIAAPSANLSGKPSPTAAKHVMQDLAGRVDMVIDGGRADFGIESTVIDLSGEKPQILRPGAVTLEQIKEFLPNACYGGGGEGVPKSPGMKYTHYAPNAKVIMVQDMAALGPVLEREMGKVGLLAFDGAEKGLKADVVLSAGRDNADYAARLFYLLREFDERGVDVIYAQKPEGGGIGYGVLNRLSKSAGGREL